MDNGEEFYAALTRSYNNGYAEAWADAIDFVDSQREDFTDLREVRDRMKNMAPDQKEKD